MSICFQLLGRSQPWAVAEVVNQVNVNPCQTKKQAAQSGYKSKGAVPIQSEKCSSSRTTTWQWKKFQRDNQPQTVSTVLLLRDRAYYSFIAATGKRGADAGQQNWTGYAVKGKQLDMRWSTPIKPELVTVNLSDKTHKTSKCEPIGLGHDQGKQFIQNLLQYRDSLAQCVEGLLPQVLGVISPSYWGWDQQGLNWEQLVY